MDFEIKRYMYKLVNNGVYQNGRVIFSKVIDCLESEVLEKGRSAASSFPARHYETREEIEYIRDVFRMEDGFVIENVYMYGDKIETPYIDLDDEHFGKEFIINENPRMSSDWWGKKGVVCAPSYKSADIRLIDGNFKYVGFEIVVNGKLEICDDYGNPYYSGFHLNEITFI